MKHLKLTRSRGGVVIDSYNRRVIKDGTIGTITTGIDFRNNQFVVEDDPENKKPTNYPLCVLIKEATKKGYKAAEFGDGIDISTRMESHRGTVQKGMAQTLTTEGGENVGVIVKEKSDEKG